MDSCPPSRTRITLAGHIYSLENLDGSGYQTIRFVRRRDEKGERLPESEPGILAQDLLRVLIDRTLYLYAELPCDEDTEILEHLREALRLYESRAARRSIEKITKPEFAEVCGNCGHILCRCESREQREEDR